ncbi:MAG TPA: OPT/YSL family transporter [Verrucomicrobiales bacterium]|nr:OPT/YSL family transporter [Verrucomicrobiales bacterium]
MNPNEAPADSPAPKFRRWLPEPGSRAYHILLTAVALLILGPLGGISASFMNFSIGFFIGGQVLAGILGSAVTLPYGPEGKHGANYMQTMAASVAGMSAMAPLVQAMVWMGLPEPPVWQLILYFMSIGMFGVGVGMLYTPVLVDRLKLTYPSGLAVANILRALTDKVLLKRSISKLGGSIAVGFAGAFAAAKAPVIAATGLSMSTFGGGLIVGARIAFPALVVATIGWALTPHLQGIGWLGPNDHYRRIGFIISLGAILGAASLDLLLILTQTARRLISQRATPAPPAEDWKRVNFQRLVLWVVFWGAAIVIIGSTVLQQPLLFLLVAVGLCFLFVLTNGIALGISDFNPISSAFVMSVFLMAALGLRDPGVGLLCAAILAIATSEGGDMQQDRSTGWRLGTNRIIQFRYQVIGIAAGAVLAVALAKLFMSAYPVLRVDQLSNPDAAGVEKWQSAFTYKMVGALRGITVSQPHVIKALLLGITIGLVIELARKIIKGRKRYQEFTTRSPEGRTAGFVLDAFLLPSPYAFAFGGFVEFITVAWWTAGGLCSLAYQGLQALRRTAGTETESALPSDMSTTSLAGGGLIAGDALASLAIGVSGLLRMI